MTVISVTLLVIVALFAVVPAQAGPVSVSAILATPDRFDGHTVTISGSITNRRETVSRRGNPYYTFDLSDGKRAIRVFSFGKSPCRSGLVTVNGTFQKVKRQGRNVFHNEIEAENVTCEGE